MDGARRHDLAERAYRWMQRALVAAGVSAAWCVPFFAAAHEWEIRLLIGGFVGINLVGLGLWVLACADLARSRGRSASWGLLGLLALVGWGVAGCLRERR